MSETGGLHKTKSVQYI